MQERPSKRIKVEECSADEVSKMENPLLGYSFLWGPGVTRLISSVKFLKHFSGKFTYNNPVDRFLL